MKATLRLRVDVNTTLEVVVNELLKLLPSLGQKRISDIDYAHRFVDPSGQANVIRLVDAREYDPGEYSAQSRSKRESNSENELQLLEEEAKRENKNKAKEPGKGYVKL